MRDPFSYFACLETATSISGEQVLDMKDTEFVARALKVKVLVEATKEEFDAYQASLKESTKEVENTAKTVKK
jgi:hypothetical protein